MNGKVIYFAIASTIGVLSALDNKLFFSMFAVYVLFLLIRKSFSKYKMTAIFAVFFIFFLSAKGSFLYKKTDFSGDETNFLIYFNKELHVDGELMKTYAADQKTGEEFAIRYRVLSKEEKAALPDFLLGKQCLAVGKLEKPALPRNKNAFNYRKYLNREGIHWVLKIDDIHFQTCKPQSSFLISLRILRQNGISYIERYFPDNAAQVSAALIFGERNLYEPEILKTYEKIGIVHLLAISGLQVSLLSGMIFIFGLRIGITKERMQNALLIVLPVYGILTGASPSVIRAVIMTILVLISLKFTFKHRLSPIDAVSIALMCYTFFNPFVIYNAGFQLSFTVSYCLILSASSILPRFKSHILALLATTLISQLSSLPIVLFHFYEISIISLLANLFFVPLYSFVFTPAALISFMIHFISPKLAAPLVNFFDSLVTFSNGIAHILSEFPYATVTLGRPHLIVLLLYVITLLLFFYLWEKKKVLIRIFWIPVVSMIIQGMLHYISPYGEVTFIDVGQGDSILIRLPHGQGTFLIDTGGTIRFEKEKWQERKKDFEVGKNVVVPFLKSKGITTIDKLILTHGDQDHIGGAHALLEEMNVKEILLPLIAEKSELERKIIKKADEKNIPVKFAKGQEGWKSGNSLFQILLPVEKQVLDRNNGSIVILAKIGGLKWLLTGDLEKEGEEVLVNNYKHTAIDVIKVGHHGSKSSTSDELLRHFSPKGAIISAGENNRYGHPHKEVLHRLEKYKIKIFRTDQQGAVTYSFRGNHGTFSVVIP
ncbi:DNA internalization-related competence protein ComEC/Rec2 [Bacillus methanolicus]|uniref:DNA internalization-related competence protein ComEC/Rec2 n=1 Tax=Bacillus methanolicus (strain MGA3 / ATCC 53907) TaxID=796606 RepID=I3EAQ1_BACMM|nr:DNA internalization-related competence protein ComEC/Rec2 [Bacillus methanolicus]AIE60810.1 DNA internalization-related competence protein ComEC/Rec2 [Bacillus methanolicus MGA3]EIJ83572.1 ComE operon protein [Bacillus methanolicus MGA3]